MRTLSPAEAERIRSARAEGTSWTQLARALTADDHAAGLLPPGVVWTPRALAYIAEHPAPVRVEGTR